MHPFSSGICSPRNMDPKVGIGDKVDEKIRVTKRPEAGEENPV